MTLNRGLPQKRSVGVEGVVLCRVARRLDPEVTRTLSIDRVEKSAVTNAEETVTSKVAKVTLNLNLNLN